MNLVVYMGLGILRSLLDDGSSTVFLVVDAMYGFYSHIILETYLHKAA